MNQSQITGMLYKQLELLAERSQKCADEELAKITLAMVEIYNVLNQKTLTNQALTVVVESAIDSRLTLDMLSRKISQQLDLYTNKDGIA